MSAILNKTMKALLSTGSLKRRLGKVFLWLCTLFCLDDNAEARWTRGTFLCLFFAKESVAVVRSSLQAVVMSVSFVGIKYSMTASASALLDFLCSESLAC